MTPAQRRRWSGLRISALLRGIVVLMALVALQTRADANPAPSDANILGAYLSGKTGLEPLNQLVYKSQQLRLADSYYTWKRSEARVVLLGQYNDGPGRPSLDLGREEYLHRWNEIIDSNIHGTKLGDVPLGSVLALGTTLIAALATDGASVLSKKGSDFAASKLAQQMNQAMIFDPVSIPGADARIAYQYGSVIQKEIQLGSPLGKELQKALKDAFGVEDISKLKNSAEVQQFFSAQAAATVAIRKGDINSYLADRTAALAAHAQTQDQLLAGILEQAKRQQTLEQYRASRDAELANFHAIGAGLEFGALAAGANEDQIQMIRLFDAAGEAVIEAASASASDPGSYGNAYYAAFRFGIALVSSGRRNGGDTEAILKAIQALSERLEEMRKEMNVRFDVLTAIHKHTAILDADQLQSLRSSAQLELEELARLDRRITADQSTLLTAIEKFGNREDDVLWSKCASAAVEEAAGDCMRRGFLASTKWALTDSVAASFADPQSPLAAKSGYSNTAGPQDLLESISAIVPLYSQFRTGWSAIRVANPHVWNWGARLYLAPVENTPKAFDMMQHEKMEQMLAIGTDIQRFFQTFYVNESNDKRVVTLEPLGAMLSDYSEAAGQLIMHFDARFKDRSVLPSQLGGSLPEELSIRPSPQSAAAASASPTVRDPAWGVAKKFLANDDVAVNNFESSKRNVEKGRGVFNPEQSHRYGLLTHPLRLCDDGKSDWKYLGGAGDPNWWLQHVAQPDQSRLKNLGLPIDASFLALLPREALWLERLDANRYEIRACIVEHHTTYGGGIDVFPWTSWVPYTIAQRVRVSLGDKILAVLYPVATLEGALKTWVIYDSVGSYIGGPWPTLEQAWLGSTINGSHVGPIAGNCDRFFKVMSRSDDESKSLASLRTILESRKGDEQRVFAAQFFQGDLGEAAESLTLKWRVLLAAQLLAGDDLPEVGLAYQQIITNPEFVLTPTKIVEDLLGGNSVRLADQLTTSSDKTRVALSALEGREIGRPVHTPLDQSIESLELARVHLLMVARGHRVEQSPDGRRP